MHSLIYILYYILIISYCNGCFPTPNQEPTLCGSCPALSGAKVTISSPTTPDATCAYTAIATCTPSIALVQFNGASAPLLPSPQTITCDGITSQWSYSNAGVQTPFSTIQCICPQQVCAGFGVGGINFSPSNPGFRLALPDNNCVYTYIAQSCVNPTEMNINFNFNAEILSIPRTIQCTGGEPNAYYFNGANVLTPLMDMFCQP
uniref:Uncharacterized protein n=1 Tax=Panagrolaimus sp. PS1159 TaxID=55785 RepID=A0AC35FW13_9BILA